VQERLRPSLKKLLAGRVSDASAKSENLGKRSPRARSTNLSNKKLEDGDPFVRDKKTPRIISLVWGGGFGTVEEPVVQKNPSMRF